MEELEISVSENDVDLRCKGWCHDVSIEEVELRCKGWCHDVYGVSYSEKPLSEQKYFN
jgi:predicted 3-demethylubiquinone-9 3-methyltransferase (glyoxalase superfamily)